MWWTTGGAEVWTLEEGVRWCDVTMRGVGAAAFGVAVSRSHGRGLWLSVGGVRECVQMRRKGGGGKGGEGPREEVGRPRVFNVLYIFFLGLGCVVNL